MKKLLLSAALLSALAAVAEKAQPERTGPFRPAYDSPTSETFRRYEAVENTKGAGFYWIDSTRGDVWRIDSETVKYH
ncbi:MAG: hypothetical protein WCG03_06015 [Kiritimatiellales bacterium]